MAAKRETLAEYLKWAALKPRTTDWSALVAYDKRKCNQLLLQQYIEKYDKQSVMPPINQAYGSSETTWSWLLDYVTDAPRLSFENNPDRNSAEVNMSMAIIGGKNVSLDDVTGSAQINRISSFDPLDYPQLVADRVELKDVGGTVTDDGEVVLDLGDPDSQRYTWEVMGDRIVHQRRMAGAFFKRMFREADPEKRTFSLGKLATTTQAFMKPQSFSLRTVMEEGAATRGAANFGNGAVEMRIAMDGELQGGFPGEDWLYPLPSDRPDMDTLTVFGSKFFMHGIIGKGTARAFNAPTAEFDGEQNSKGFTYRIKVKQGTQGALEVPRFTATVGGGRRVDYYGYTIPIFINSDELLTMSLYDSGSGEPHFEVGMGSEDAMREMKCYIANEERTFRMGLGFSATYFFSIDPTSRRLVVTLGNREGYVKVSNEGIEDFPEDVINHMNSDGFKWEVLGKAAEATLALFNGLDDIDVFVLHTLLFNAEDAVQLKTLHLPGEMVLFGSISPRLTTFAIDPIEIMLTHGGDHRFKTEPAVTGVTWRVENLRGDTTNPGQMNPATGEYIAPALADIHGTYKRVKVIATGPGTGSNRHISRALVTIVARSITLNPLVEICNVSASADHIETRKFSAHSLAGALNWRVEGVGSINPMADENGENLYRAPLKQEEGGPSFTIDEVVVANAATGQEQRSLIVLKHFPSALALSLDFQGLPAKQVKLIAKLAGNIPTVPLAWTCTPAEAGSMNPDTGIFTASTTTSSQFVVITALLDVAGMTFDGFTILFLPLAPLPPKPAPEIPQTPSLDELNDLLSEVYGKFEEVREDPSARERAKALLNTIATLAEDHQNGQ